MSCTSSSGDAGGAGPRQLGTASPQNIQASGSELGVPHKNLEFTKKSCPSPVTGELAPGFPGVPDIYLTVYKLPKNATCRRSWSEAMLFLVNAAGLAPIAPWCPAQPGHRGVGRL